MKRLLVAFPILVCQHALAQSTFTDSCGTSDWFSTCTINNACGPGQSGCQNNWYASLGCGTDCPLPFPGPLTDVLVPTGGIITMNGGSADVRSFDCERPFALRGSLNVRSDSTIRAGLSWLSGALSAPSPAVNLYFPAGSTLSISGSDGKNLSGAQLVLDQAAVWTGGPIGLTSGAKIVSNAFFNVNVDANITFNGGTPVSFENYGEFRKQGTSGLTIVGVEFNNYDDLIVTSGTLRMSNSGTCRGPITLSGPSVFETAFGNYNFAAGTSVQGAGLLLVNGQLNLLDPVTVDKIELQTSLNGPGDLRVLLDMHWPSGTMAGGGVTRIPSFAGLRLTTGNSKTLSNRSIENAGAMSLANGGSLNLVSGSVVSNLGTVDLQSDASINFAGGTPCSFENSGTLQKSGGAGTSIIGTTMNSSGPIDVQSGTLRLSNSGLDTGPITVAAGSILEFAFGNYSLGTGASITGDGLARMNGNTILLGNVLCENAELTSSLTGPGDLLLQNSMNWISGIMSGGGTTIVTPSALLQLTSGNSKTLSARTLANQGTTQVADNGSINLVSGSILNNTGTLDLQSDASINFAGGTPCSLENSGTLVKSGGTGLSIIGTTLNSSGSVDVQTGTLRLSNSGLGTGSFTLAPNTVLEFAFGNYNFGTGASVSGPGLARMNGTTILLDDVSFENVELTAALTGGGDLIVQNSMNWISGQMSGGGETVIPSGATMTLSSANSKSMSNRLLRVEGHLLDTGTGGISTSSGGGIRNDGLFEMVASSNINFAGGVPTTFENFGTFRKSGDNGFTDIGGIPFNNHGVVDVQSGTLRMSNSGTNDGQIQLAAPAVLEFALGNYRLGAGSSVTGDGIARINGNAFVLGDATIERADLSANLVGPGDVHITRDMTWTTGSMSGGGTTIIEPGATLALNDLNSKSLSARSLRNRGVATVSGTGGISFVSGATWENEGTLDLLVGNTFVFQGGVSCSISNTGTISKKPGSATTSVPNMPLYNAGMIELQGGTFAAGNLIQTAGATRVSDGATLQCSQPMALGGGTLSGSGLVAGAVTNTGGRTQPGDAIGQLTISGTYTQGGGGLDIDIAGTTAVAQYDQLAVGGSATLGGELRLTFVNGFEPQVNDSFTVLTAGSITGTFANVVGAGQFGVAYTPTSVVVTVLAPPCVGDLNGDQRVDLTDLSTLLTNFGTSGGATLAQGDLNGDGNVNLTDLAVLLGNFGLDC